MTTKSAREMAYATIIDTVPSGATTMKWALAFAPSIVRMIVSSVTSSSTASWSGLPGRFAHRETGRFGSASIMTTFFPDSASCVASSTAEVDLPAPPLGLANTMVDIGHPSLEVDARHAAGRPLPTGRQTANGRPTVNRLLSADCPSAVSNRAHSRSSGIRRAPAIGSEVDRARSGDPVPGCSPWAPGQGRGHLSRRRLGLEHDGMRRAVLRRIVAAELDDVPPRLQPG